MYILAHLVRPVSPVYPYDENTYYTRQPMIITLTASNSSEITDTNISSDIEQFFNGTKYIQERLYPEPSNTDTFDQLRNSYYNRDYPNGGRWQLYFTMFTSTRNIYV